MVSEPLQGQRHVTVTDQRTRVDFAPVIKEVVDVHYPEAEIIVLVMDNLNTHDPASLYEAFEPAEAHLVALVCGAPPEGQQRWTLHLLKDTLIEGGYTDTVSHETVRQRLKKMNLSLG